VSAKHSLCAQFSGTTAASLCAGVPQVFFHHLHFIFQEDIWEMHVLMSVIVAWLSMDVGKPLLGETFAC
jgi:hypothetical protein